MQLKPVWIQLVKAFEKRFKSERVYALVGEDFGFFDLDGEQGNEAGVDYHAGDEG